MIEDVGSARARVRLLRAYDARAVSDATAVEPGTTSLVQQHQAEEADINTIVRRFGMTGQMPSGLGGGVYGDFTGVHDYESAVAAIERADQGFMSLPAELRARFGNDPARVIDYAQALPEDHDLQADFGLVVPVVVPPVVAAPVAPVVAPVAPVVAPR